MIGSQDKALKDKLKLLIIESCEKDNTVDDIDDNEQLFGSDTNLELDSMDALQISMALSSTYGVKTTDSKKIADIALV